MKAAGILLLTLVAGCGSALKTGNTYRDAGHHELAAYYYAAHLRANRNDPEAQATAVAGIERALTAVGADLDTRFDKGDFRGALAAAERKEELLALGRTLGLKELAAMSARPELDRTLPKARTQAVSALDAAETAHQADAALTSAVRVALALDPNNGELAGRYERLRQKLARIILPRLDCGGGAQQACDLFAASLLGVVSGQPREVTVLATPASKTRNAELVVRLEVVSARAPWKVREQGKVKDKVKRYDRFKDVIKNAKGEPVYDEVAADFTTYESSASVELRGRIELRDLGPSRAVLFARDVSQRQDDRRAYVTWTGDERALGKHAIGTDTTPPAEPDVLMRQVVQQAAASVANELVSKLEGATK
jgi:hypothetical protein